MRPGPRTRARGRDGQVVLAEVHAVRADRARDVGAVVHDEERARRGACSGADARAPREQRRAARRRFSRSCSRRAPPASSAAASVDRVAARVERVDDRVEPRAGVSRLTRGRRRPRIGMPSVGDLLPQRVAVDAEHVGGLQLVAAGALEHQLDQRPLDGADDASCGARCGSVGVASRAAPRGAPRTASSSGSDVGRRRRASGRPARSRRA